MYFLQISLSQVSQKCSWL